MTAYESELARFDSLDTQVLGISVDSVPCHQAWQKTLGGISYPLLSDFWPHGKVCKLYDTLLDKGYSDRIIFIVDKQGLIVYKEIVGVRNWPDNEKVFRQLERMR